MSPAIAPLPFKAMASLRKWTVDEYDQLIEDDRVELLEGYAVLKMPANPPQDASVTALHRRLDRLVPPDRIVRCRVGARLAESRPEPDVSVVRGPEREYFTRHPEPADLGLVVEVADSSLDRDQLDKSRIYSRPHPGVLDREPGGPACRDLHRSDRAV